MGSRWRYSVRCTVKRGHRDEGFWLKGSGFRARCSGEQGHGVSGVGLRIYGKMLGEIGTHL